MKVAETVDRQKVYLQKDTCGLFYLASSEGVGLDFPGRVPEKALLQPITNQTSEDCSIYSDICTWDDLTGQIHTKFTQMKGTQQGRRI